MSELIAATRHAITGLVVGATVAKIGDVVFQQSLAMLGPLQNTTPGGKWGRAAYVVVAGSTVVAASVLGGDYIMEGLSSSTADPLYRAIYYNTALVSSTTARGIAYAVQNALPVSRQSLSGDSPASSPPPPAAAAVSGESGCTSGTCGA